MGIVNYKKIMIATEGSACSGMATDKGIELARLSGGTVYAVYVTYIRQVDVMNLAFLLMAFFKHLINLYYISN